MVDCSHGNSQKNHNNQPLVLSDLARTLASGDPHARHITGVMIESNIYPGRQDVPKDYTAANDPLVNGTQTVADVTQIPQSTSHTLKYGVSITDACVDWQTTLNMLDELNEAVEKRRQALAATT
ncbi:hypothetical protein ONZ45_g18774 [Pleurotus djamor]|nr:hypothetical protein ONZ45_g18774 [Pleurotus djamor]